MPRLEYNKPPGRNAGHGNVVKAMDLSILTRAQRAAYDNFRQQQRIESSALSEANAALKEQQIAMAQMALARLSIKRIREITQLSDHKVRDMIDHGKIHLGIEVADND